MFYQRLMNELKSMDVVIYGAGANGEYLYDYLTHNGIKAKYFLDKNKCGQLVKG